MKAKTKLIIVVGLVMLLATACVKGPGGEGKRAKGSERWVKPTAVAEISFVEWTPDGSVRHPTFRGMREDKPAKAIRRESSAKSR